MSNVAICIKELKDKPDQFFGVKKADLSNYDWYVEVQARDASGNVLLNQDSKPVMEQVKIIIDAEGHKNTMDKWINEELNEELRM